MLIKKPDDIKSSEITDKSTYLNRRLFMRAAALAGTAMATTIAYRKLNPAPVEQKKAESIQVASSADSNAVNQGFTTNEKQTPLKDITNYNNFYEFDTSKGGVASAAKNFVTRPWTVAVGGLVNKPTTFDLDQLLKIQQEERIYRLRCVEGWSMVIPWVGFSLSKLLEKVEPNSSAKYVAFETLLDPKRMPNQNYGVLDWPYVE